MLGVTQVRELGEMETPILLTCTLCVWRAADAMVGWMLERDDMQEVRSLNALVGETNDGGLNDIRARPISPEHVREALEGAALHTLSHARATTGLDRLCLAGGVALNCAMNGAHTTAMVNADVRFHQLPGPPPRLPGGDRGPGPPRG